VADEFDAVSWREIADALESGVGDSFFEYPNRSVIQFTDFIQSLKETEGMDRSFDKERINERLSLYFEYSELIEEVEKANSQFEVDFDELSEYLRRTWEDRLHDEYEFEDSGWVTYVATNVKWQKIYPEYWEQNPEVGGEVQMFFRHSPKTDALRDGRLSFRLRLPSHRDVHMEDYEGNGSFNEVFTDLCSDGYREQIREVLDDLEVDDVSLGSASALFTKHYDLEPSNLTDSYIERLCQACGDFCENPDVVQVFDEVFEEAYRTAFEEEPSGEPPSTLRRKS